MFAAAPQLLTERFWRMIVVTYACCLLHILVAFHTKAPTLAWFDAIHIAVFSVSGFCAHYFDSRLRIKTFLTGLQRDTLTRRLRLAHRDLKRRAEHDGLTGLLTRNALVRRLKPVLAGERAFFLGIMDIDDFRGINDTFGHSAGMLSSGGWGPSCKNSSAMPIWLPASAGGVRLCYAGHCRKRVRREPAAPDMCGVLHA